MNVELVHVNKSFGPVHANDDICLDIPTGVIQGILGENGAGKSTLMKILSGFYTADSGQILLDGNPVQIKSPSNANDYGIGMLHQDPLDFPSMRVVEDLIIGSKGGIFPDSKQTITQFLDLQ
ncbi:MAG TPA: ATP-binding cassette domain-containing protein, partial [Bellilinea sp.]|nr:ATP-binding cassette domain-containing protein [Bellilinea sp.]